MNTSYSSILLSCDAKPRSTDKVDIPGQYQHCPDRELYNTIGLQRTYYVVQTVVAQKYNKTPEQLRCKCRKFELKESRQICMMIGNKFLKLSQVVAAVPFSRNHSTVSHSCQVIKNLYTVDREFRKKLISILNELKIPIEILSY